MFFATESAGDEKEQDMQGYLIFWDSNTTTTNPSFGGPPDPAHLLVVEIPILGRDFWLGNYSVPCISSTMSYSFLDTTFAILDDNCEVMDSCLYDDDQPMQEQLQLKSIIKKRSLLEQLGLSAISSTPKGKKKKKCVVFRDPICEVRLYDKVAAKRQQWGHSTKFCRVKRFCWDNEEEDVRRDKTNRWLPNTEDQDYRLMMWRDVQQRRLNRKRRLTGESLAYLVQGLEISPNCVEEVKSKMRKTQEMV